MKVLHVVENLHRGAVENWLVRMLRHARRNELTPDWTFYCILGKEGQLDDEVRSLVGGIVRSPVQLTRKLEFVRALRSELKRGCYDVLHCHHDLVSALYLIASAGLEIRRRIVHVHNADESIPVTGKKKADLLRPVLRRTALMLADRIVGISQHTLDTFLAGEPRHPGRDRVHYYGIDSRPFLDARGDRAGFRRELGLSGDCLILLFAGRMVPEKNPLFAVEVFAEMWRRDHRVAGVFVGSGSMESQVRSRAGQLGVLEQSRMLGWRDDLPEIMSACDWFILPRPERPIEGLGIAVVEAQLAGLRMLLSAGIADDPILPGTVCARLPLAAGPERWAVEALEQLKRIPPTREEARAILAGSPFDLDFALRDLLSLYA